MVLVTSGGGEQSSREGCGEECRRPTMSPPDPDATVRSMTSRSSVTRRVGRDVVTDCSGETFQRLLLIDIETQAAADMEHYRQRHKLHF